MKNKNVFLHLSWQDGKFICQIDKNIVYLYGHLHILQYKPRNNLEFELVLGYLIKEILENLSNVYTGIMLEDVCFVKDKFAKHEQLVKIKISGVATCNVVFLAYDVSSLSNLIDQWDLRMHKLRLPKLLSGSMNVQCKYGRRIIHIASSSTVFLAKSRLQYLKVKLLFDGKLEELYLPKNFLQQIISAWSQDKIFRTTEFFTTVVLEIFLNVISKITNCHVEVENWLYGYLENEEYRMVEINSNKFNSHLLLNCESVIINAILNNPNNIRLGNDEQKIFDNNDKLLFPVIIGVTTSNFEELSKIKIGDTLLLEQQSQNEYVAIDCSRVSIIATYEDNALQILGVDSGIN